jgi:LCP family protein required for cell wall assembly
MEVSHPPWFRRECAIGLMRAPRELHRLRTIGAVTRSGIRAQRWLDDPHERRHLSCWIQIFAGWPCLSANEKGLQALGKRRRWSTKRKIAVSLAAVAGLVVFAAVAGYGYVRYQFDQVPRLACRACVHAGPGEPYNILVIGSDSRSGNTGQAASSFGMASTVGGQRSDTIKIIRIDPDAGTAKVLSIPRDTYVTTSGLAPDSGLTGAEKINAAFNNGPEALIETIQNTFGIPISHWIVIDFIGVIDAVKALGGIRLDFNYPVRDDYDGVNESGLQIASAGCQDLDGSATLSLSRSRNYQYYRAGEWHLDPGSDLSRIERQNTIIEAMMAKARTTYNPFTLQSLIDTVRDNVVIDNNLTLGMIYELAERYHAFSPSSLQTWTLPTVGQSGTPAGDVELVTTAPADDYVDTVTRFLGGPGGPITTPPLDQNGNAITASPVTTTTGDPLQHRQATSSRMPDSRSSPTTTLPPYEPTLC